MLINKVIRYHETKYSDIRDTRIQGIFEDVRSQSGLRLINILAFFIEIISRIETISLNRIILSQNIIISAIQRSSAIRVLERNGVKSGIA